MTLPRDPPATRRRLRPRGKGDSCARATRRGSPPTPSLDPTVAGNSAVEDETGAEKSFLLTGLGSGLDTLGELVDATVVRTGALRKNIRNNVANNLRSRKSRSWGLGSDRQRSSKGQREGLVECVDCTAQL